MKLKNLKGQISTFEDLHNWVSSDRNIFTFDHYELIATDWLYVNIGKHEKLDDITNPLIKFKTDDGFIIITDNDPDEKSTFLNFWNVLEAEKWFDTSEESVTHTDEVEYEHFNLRHTNNPTVSFDGKKLAYDSSEYENNRENISWNDFHLYQTKAGKYICQNASFSLCNSPEDGFFVEVCDSIEDVIKFFGHTDLAKSIYKEAGISASLKIE
jgi:hypothetical protein